jgi:nucleotide-binding universal stress UspA family protein
VNRIVIGYDGSAHARRALERAIAIADPGAELRVVAAVPLVPRAGRGPGPAPLDPEDVEARDRALAEAKELVAGKNLQMKSVEGIGDPAGTIVEEARASGAELIVVGTRGLNRAARILLGSVSTAVVHHAPCDVLVVR